MWNVSPAKRLQIDWVASGGPGTPPASLGLPFDLGVRRGSIQELAMGARGAAPTVFQRVEFSGRMNLQGIDVVGSRGRVRAHPHPGTGAHRCLRALRHGGTRATEQLAAGPVRHGDRLGDRFTAAASASTAAPTTVPRGRASTLSSWPSPTCHSSALHVDIESFDPALWMSDVPSMQLRARADLAPTTLADGTWSVGGPFSAENSAAGPIDRDRLPVRSLRGTLAWAAQTLRLDVERAEGVRGSANGALIWSRADGVQAAARFSGIDASTLHSQMVATNASGQIDYSLIDGEQRFVGSARNTGALPLSADIDASVRAQVLDVARARLSLGEGRADLRGRFELGGTRSARFSGSFKDLDLARLVRGIDTRLNGTLDVDGRLQTPLSGRATFALAESRIAGRPISGRGRIEAAGARLDADVELRSGTARLAALGGIGAGRELKLELVAPELETLLPGYGGRIDARATLAGRARQRAHRCHGSRRRTCCCRAGTASAASWRRSVAAWRPTSPLR